MFVRDLEMSEFRQYTGSQDCATALDVLQSLERKIVQMATHVILFADDSSTASHGRRYSNPTAARKESYLKQQLNNSVSMMLSRHCRHSSLNWTIAQWEDLLFDLLAAYSGSCDDFYQRRKDLSRIGPVYSPSYWPDYWHVPHAHWANKKYNR